MLPSHAYYIRPPLCRVEQQSQSQSSLGADRVLVLEYGNVLFGPCIDSSRPLLWFCDSHSRIVGKHFDADRVVEERTDRPQKISGFGWSRRLGSNEMFDMLTFECRNPLVTVVSTKALQDAPSLFLAFGRKIGELQRIVVACNRRIYCAR